MSKFKEIQDVYVERLTGYKNLKLNYSKFICQLVDKIVTHLEWPAEKVSYIDSIDSKRIQYPAQSFEIEQILTSNQGFWKFRLELELPLDFESQVYPVVFTMSISVCADKNSPDSNFYRVKVSESKEIFERVTIDNTNVIEEISINIMNIIKAKVDKIMWDIESIEIVDLDKI